MATIINIFQRCIEPAYVLKRENAFWVIEESNQNTRNPKLLVNGSGIFGFSLDAKTMPAPAWKFIQSSTLPGLCSVCDGIFVTSMDSIDYFIAIDLKSTNTNGATKQLATSLHLCNWFYKVLNLHGHLIKDVKFAGVISKINIRRQPTKKTSVRKTIPNPTFHYDYPIFTLENFDKISLTDICKKI